jgi:hypothetical protein
MVGVGMLEVGMAKCSRSRDGGAGCGGAIAAGVTSNGKSCVLKRGWGARRVSASDSASGEAAGDGCAARGDKVGDGWALARSAPLLASIDDMRCSRVISRCSMRSRRLGVAVNDGESMSSGARASTTWGTLGERGGYRGGKTRGEKIRGLKKFWAQASPVLIL